MDEGQAVPIARLELLNRVDLRPTGLADTERRLGEHNQGWTVLSDGIGDRQLMHVIGGLSAVDVAHIRHIADRGIVALRRWLSRSRHRGLVGHLKR